MVGGSEWIMNKVRNMVQHMERGGRTRDIEPIRGLEAHVSVPAGKGDGMLALISTVG